MEELNYMDFQETIEASFQKTLEPFKRILKHYNCPEYCQATCCKTCDIEVGKLERKKILKRYPSTFKTFRTEAKIIQQPLSSNSNVTLVGYKFKEKPCPLLINNRCSIQDAKPSTCYLYPFALARHPTDPEQIALEPCPMGIDVIADYLLFKFLSVYHSKKLTVEERESMFEGDLELFRQAVDSLVNMETDNYVLDLYIHEELIPYFAEFLDGFSEEDKKHDREAFGIEQIRIEKFKKFSCVKSPEDSVKVKR